HDVGPVDRATAARLQDADLVGRDRGERDLGRTQIAVFSRQPQFGDGDPVRTVPILQDDVAGNLELAGVTGPVDRDAADLARLGQCQLDPVVTSYLGGCPGHASPARVDLGIVVVQLAVVE